MSVGSHHVPIVKLKVERVVYVQLEVSKTTVQ